MLVQVVYCSIGLHGATIRFVAQGSTTVIYKLSSLVSPNVGRGIDDEVLFFNLP
jgi:hypothetical protein